MAAAALGSGRVNVLASQRCGNAQVNLSIAQGSACDFGNPEWNRDTTAVVNAANCGGLTGGGLDAEFVQRGGDKLAADRLQMPFVSGTNRIAVGSVGVTGPADYGSLFAKTIIHAVGPNYGNKRQSDKQQRRADDY